LSRRGGNEKGRYITRPTTANERLKCEFDLERCPQRGDGLDFPHADLH
jgi:hypothetical protein